MVLENERGLIFALKHTQTVNLPQEILDLPLVMGILVSMTIGSTSISVYCVTMSHISRQIHCSMVTQEQKNYFSMSNVAGMVKN